MNRRQRERRLRRAQVRPVKPVVYIYEPGRNERVDMLVAYIKVNDWQVRFVEYCEDIVTPGLLGQYAGVCDGYRQTIKVKTTGASEEQIVAVLEHEIEHMNGAERGTDHPLLGLRCGGRTNGMGQ